jgi:hypothetical protein
VVAAVPVEPVSFQKFSLTGKLTGNLANSRTTCNFGEPVSQQIQWFPATFPQQRNREYLAPYQRNISPTPIESRELFVGDIEQSRGTCFIFDALIRESL